MIIAFFSSVDNAETGGKLFESFWFESPPFEGLDIELAFKADGGSHERPCFFGFSSCSSSANADAVLRTTGSTNVNEN